MEDRRRRARTSGAGAPRYLRTGTHRVRAASRRDDRSGIYRRDERRRHRSTCPPGYRAGPASAFLLVPGRAAFHVPHDFADGYPLSRQRPERGPRGTRARRRPFAVGPAGIGRRRQLHAARFHRLAGPRVRRRHARAPGRVRRAVAAAARVSLAPGNRAYRPATECRLSRTARWIRGVGGSRGERRDARVLPGRAKAHRAARRGPANRPVPVDREERIERTQHRIGRGRQPRASRRHEAPKIHAA